MIVSPSVGRISGARQLRATRNPPTGGLRRYADLRPAAANPPYEICYAMPQFDKELGE